MEVSLDLKDPLTEMGLGSVFEEGGADFSGISEKHGMHVSKMLQKVVLEVRDIITQPCNFAQRYTCIKTGY